MKSWKKPTPELISRAIAGMPYLEHQRYFFERLDNPEWIEPLRKAKFFDQFPTPAHEGNVVTFYLWPASRYLARMAGLKPDLVAEIMGVFPETGNPFLIQDILNAALAMPPAAAAKLADALARSARSKGLIGMDRAGEIAANLAEAGESKAALVILHSVLDVVPDPRPVTVGPSGHVYRHEAQTAIRGFDYASIFRKSGERLASSLGADYLTLLSGQLVFALAQEYPHYKKAARPVEDYSYIWRAHLDHWDMHEVAKHLLIFGILQASERMASEGRWKEAQQILERRPFVVFERIQLFVLAKYPNWDLDLAVKKLSDSTLFHSFGLRQEYNQLLRVVFPKMSVDQQNLIFALIDSGLDQTRMNERGLSKEQIEQLVHQWTLERYEPIRQSLPPERIPQVELLEKEFGVARTHENLVVRGGAVPLGGNSPASSADLQAMSVDEVFDYLRTWSPNASEPFGPSYQGLARELTTAIEAAPKRFLPRLDEFKKLPPTYVRAAFQGFREAARNGVTMAWSPLLELAEWICSQRDSSEQAEQDDWHGHDSSWHPTRFAIVDTLGDAIKNGVLPVELDALAWKLIDTLSNDESECLNYNDPTAQARDVWSYSLNTLRPRAVRVGFKYVEWRFNRLKAEGRSIDDIPEILAYLDKHLAPATEKCLSVRLIYGERFPFLNLVAPRWASRSRQQIFPNEPELQPLRDVAWGAYLAANQAYIDLFAILEAHYREAIGIPDESRLQGKGHMMDHPSALLAHHLIQLYWWGKIGLEENSPLAKFLAGVDENALRSAIIYVGQSLSESPNDVAHEVITRLQTLWDYILESERAKKPNEVFGSFGWWFNTSYFDDQWVLDRLERSLRLAQGKYEPLLDALGRLSRLVETNPYAVVDCSRMIVLGADEYVDLWTSELDHILRVGLSTGDANVVSATTDLINELGRRGHHSYRSLIKASGID
jgi:hypothetical protein